MYVRKVNLCIEFSQSDTTVDGVQLKSKCAVVFTAKTWSRLLLYYFYYFFEYLELWDNAFIRGNLKRIIYVLVIIKVVVKKIITKH